MLNTRGNLYSRDHKTLDSCSDCEEFWDFSFDESARYDYPAVIDYVLNSTLAPDLFFVGYSMGATQYLILLSELPEYNTKIKAGYLMGPPAFMNTASNPLIGIKRPLLALSSFLGIHEMYPNSNAEIISNICLSSNLAAYGCHYIWNGLANTDRNLMELKTSMIHLTHMPAGASIKSFLHYFQFLYNGGKFEQFNYGNEEKNRLIYGTSEPPEYDLNKVNAPTVLYCGDGDDYTNLDDTQHLANSLPNLRDYIIVDRPGWTHLDFAYSNDAGHLVYKRIIEDLNKF